MRYTWVPAVFATALASNSDLIKDDYMLVLKYSMVQTEDSMSRSWIHLDEGEGPAEGLLTASGSWSARSGIHGHEAAGPSEDVEILVLTKNTDTPASLTTRTSGDEPFTYSVSEEKASSCSSRSLERLRESQDEVEFGGRGTVNEHFKVERPPVEEIVAKLKKKGCLYNANDEQLHSEQETEIDEVLTEAIAPVCVPDPEPWIAGDLQEAIEAVDNFHSLHIVNAFLESDIGIEPVKVPTSKAKEATEALSEVHAVSPIAIPRQIKDAGLIVTPQSQLVPCPVNNPQSPEANTDLKPEERDPFYDLVERPFFGLFIAVWMAAGSLLVAKILADKFQY